MCTEQNLQLMSKFTFVYDQFTFPTNMMICKAIGASIEIWSTMQKKSYF